MPATDLRYHISLGHELDKRLEHAAATLNITKSEAMRRALELFIRAIEYDDVVLKKDGVEQFVTIK